MAKVAIGVMSCQCCSKEVVIQENEHKTLSYSCQWCGDSPYQKNDKMAYQYWLKKITRIEQEKQEKTTVAAATEKPPAPEKTPEKQKKKDTFF